MEQYSAWLQGALVLCGSSAHRLKRRSERDPGEMSSPNEVGKSQEPDSIPDSQDSVQRAVNSFIRGSQESRITPTTSPVVPMSEESRIYQTSNHYELDEGRHRDHVEYSINHRVEFRQGGYHPGYSQTQASQQYPQLSAGSYYYPYQGAPLIGPNGMPNNLSEPSHFGFRVVFDEHQSTSKSATQTYSHKLQKWYVRMDTRCTITFQFDRAPPVGARVKLIVVYKTPTMLSENVECCVKHKQLESKEYGASEASHFVKSLDKQAKYLTPDPINSRNAVVVPIEAMQYNPRDSSSGSSPIQSYTAVLRFPCYTSELPKQSKGTVQLLCGLEVPHTDHFLAVARSSVDVRVCASPGRDRIDAEGLKEDSNEGHSPKLGRRKRASSPSVSQHVAISSVKRSRLSTSTKEVDQSGPYTITTVHKDIYEMLLKIKESLELTKQYTDDQIKQAVSQGVVLPGFSPPSSQEASSSEGKEILDWLRSIHMERHIGVFEQLGISELFQLERLNSEDLRSHNVPDPDIQTILESRPSQSQAEVTVDGDTQPLDSTPPQVVSSVEFRYRRTITGRRNHEQDEQEDFSNYLD